MHTITPDSTRSRLLSPSLIVAMLALIVALGGTAFAVTAGKNTVTTKSIRNGAVKTNKLADRAVKTNKLADSVISSAKIAQSAVGSRELADRAVGTGQLGDDAVTAGKLADDSVTAAAIAEGAVDNGEIAEEAVSVGKIEPGALAASRFYEATTYQANFPQVPANDCTADQPAGFENIQSGDRILVSSPAGLAAPLIIKATAQPNGIVFTLCNISGAAIDPPSLPYRILVIR